jgi:hypothetical protein
MSPKAAAADARQQAWEQKMLKDFQDKKEAEQQAAEAKAAAADAHLSAAEAKAAAQERAKDLALSISGPDYGTPDKNPMANFEMDRSLLKSVKIAPEIVKTARPEVRVV